jgi:putative glutamine amidotransferase
LGVTARRPLIGITGRKDTSARLSRITMCAVGETYIRAIQRVGGTPVVIPPTVTEADWAALLAHLDGLLLSGGEDIDSTLYGEAGEPWMGQVDGERDFSELGLTRAWLATERPLLAICRGHQVLNVALGGTLYQDIAAHIPDALDHAYVATQPMETIAHSVTLDPESRLAAILGGTMFDVNSSHHQAVKSIGDRLVVMGRAPDGVIEAVEIPAHPFCISVQWHPEAMVKASPTMWPLFEAFVQAASF